MQLPHLQTTDDRNPLFTFYVPSSSSSSRLLRRHLAGILLGTEEEEEEEVVEYEEYGFLWISIPYWIELITMLVMTLCIGAGIGLVLYWTVIQPELLLEQQKQKGQNNKPTATATMTTTGLIVPFWIVGFPFLLFSCIELRNNFFKFVIGGICPIVCFFRTIESIYGTLPSHITKSSKDFLLYYATIPIVARVSKKGKRLQQQGGEVNKAINNAMDSNNAISITTNDDNINVGDPIECTMYKTLIHLAKFIGYLFLTGLLQSILSQHRCFAYFGTGIPNNNNNDNNNVDDDESENEIIKSWWYSTERMYTWELYANNAIQALLFQLYLTTYGEGLTFAFSLITGYVAEPMMNNPLLESVSPSDFWGKRWNMIVHTVLKNGVYKPIRKQLQLLFSSSISSYYSSSSSRSVAIVATFFVSGMFHEWVLWVVFYNFYDDASTTATASTETASSSSSFQPVYGSAIIFFLWQSLLIGLEYTIGKTNFFQAVTNNCPRPVKTACIVASGLPFAHYFLDPYIRSETFFQHGAIGLPMIVPIIQQSNNTHLYNN